MKSLLMILIAFLIPIQAIRAQSYQHKADSLQTRLGHTSSDTARIVLMGDLAVIYARMSDKKQAYPLAYKALHIAQKQAYPYYTAVAHYRLANVHLLSFAVDSAITHYNITRQLLETNREKASIQLYAHATANLAQAYLDKGYAERGTELLLTALPLLEKIGDTIPYAIGLHNLAAAFLTLKDYNKAHTYLLKDIALTEHTEDDPGSKAQSYLSGTLLMYHMDSTARAKYFLDKAEQQLIILGKDRL
ncbi:hypothetical protein GCM10023231_29310 [Olivibacter ginsenosidimutans]|uniref:Tetratricopeptide repeat protein n=1 Tax=Olivibacter ginsenosidimutans TaxID=1176537 RepID=A0ABP9BPK6_9SPHI